MTAIRILAQNLRFLRQQEGLSQKAVADQLRITRGRYAKYEDAASEPPLDILIKMSDYFDIGVDSLITIDLKHS